MTTLSLLIGIFTQLLFPVALEAVQTTMHTEQKTIEIELNSTSDDLTKEIDLRQYSIPMPEECNLPNVSCKEATKVHMKITKTWDITTVYELDDERLTAVDYSLYYPDIETDEPIKRNSDPKQVKLLQKALYERGLLPVAPTGRYGAYTELAIIHFNAIKGLGECDANAVNASLATIAEINAMKSRMADPNYLTSTSPPPLNVENLCEPLQVRVAELRRFIAAATKGEVKQQLLNTSEQKVQTTLDAGNAGKTGLQIDGYIKIER